MAESTDLSIPTAGGVDLTPVIAGPSPLLERLVHFLHIWTLKIGTSVLISVYKTVLPGPPETRPTTVKSYACRPTLEHRIFFPPSWEAGSLIPLYLDIHGGGFAFGDPWIDDEFCSFWAKRTGMLVVSLSYRKAPTHPFPIPVQDIAAIAREVIDDEALPVDKSKIVMGGFSAGASLALSACQLPELKGIIKALVPFYPVVDWSTSTADKFKLRLYKERSTDELTAQGQTLSWGYIFPDQNRKDPVLSPIYAAKEDLPKWIFMVAPQHDLLTRESRNMIMQLAGMEKLDGEEEFAFEREGYRWRLAVGVAHAFTHASPIRSKKQLELDKVQYDKVRLEIQEWLANGPLAA